MTARTMRPPSPALLLLEGRAFAELGSFFAAVPWLRTLPKGDGHPVLVMPGLAAGDNTTGPLRAFLDGRGYTTYGWNLGRNLGLRPGVLAGMRHRLATIHANHGQKVSLVGWSLGGVFAREIAKMDPDAVRQVITLGSPFAGHPRATHAWRVYEMASGHSVDNPPIVTDLLAPPPVPTSSIYSRTDGVVSWKTCINKQAHQVENIEVPGSHCGLGFNPVALFAVADRLAQPENNWKPFSRRGIRGLFFRKPGEHM